MLKLGKEARCLRQGVVTPPDGRKSYQVSAKGCRGPAFVAAKGTDMILGLQEAQEKVTGT